VFLFFQGNYPDRDFDKAKWLKNKEKRYEYARDLIESGILLGKSKSEVLTMLGKDADTTRTDELGYDIGSKPAVNGVDQSYLVIDFKSGEVVTVSEYQR